MVKLYFTDSSNLSPTGVTHIDGNLAMRAIQIDNLDLVLEMCRRSCVQMSLLTTIPSVGADLRGVQFWKIV